jgi:carboxyl-terminal processing protease
MSLELLNKRVDEAEEYYKEILKKPFDFSKKEEIELDDEKNSFAKSKNELKEEWRKALKYQTLVELYSKLEIQETAKENNDTSITQKSFEELEIQARNSIKDRNEEYFERLKELNRNDRFGAYLNTIANYYDPHTSYYPPKDKENFDISISGQLEGIGATLNRKDGYITVFQIVPGSPSWKQGDLEAGDKIIKVQQDGEEAVDIVGWRLDEAVKLIRGEKGTKVHLTVKKVDGAIQNITIVRDVVIIEATYAKSAIVRKEDSRKFGYIYLPKFYANFNEKDGGRRAAEDVLKEIEKLKNEEVDGIILDLRSNGGGSLEDAVKMAGFFIPQGPIVQIKDRHGNIKTKRDVDPRVQYDGPLAIMVDKSSASASEILAAAMQDYNRAIVIGGNKTFGKGTVQSFFDLDKVVNPSLAKLRPFGSIKLTFQKFYRVNGGSTQLKGVQPDIILPDRFNYLEFGEEELDHHLKWDEIAQAKYSTVRNKSFFAKHIKESQKRTSKNQVFKTIDKQAKEIKYYRDLTKMPLNFEDYKKYRTKLRESNDSYKDILNDTTLVLVNPLKSDSQFFESDSIKRITYEKWEKDIRKDIYIRESINVLEDISLDN